MVLATIGLLLSISNTEAQNISWYNGNSPSPLHQGGIGSGGIEDTRSLILSIARSQIGVREATGKNDGFDVEKYLATTGLGNGYAWCAAYVNWVYLHANINQPKSAQAWSPSWFPAYRTYWSVGQIEYQTPQPGDVFGIYFTAKGRIAHVGIIEAWQGHYAAAIEGNTNDAGSREGDGVYRKKRMKKQVSKVSNWIK